MANARNDNFLTPLAETDSYCHKEEEFEISDEMLGHGAFATVYKGKLNNKNVAIKSINIFEDISKTHTREIFFLKKCTEDKAAYIVRLEGYCFNNTHCWIGIEFMSKGSLKNFIYDSGNAITWGRALQIAENILAGIQYLHDNGIVHRDIKLDNVLLNDSFQAKLCDFNLTAFEVAQKFEFTGTIKYLSPEIFQQYGGPYTPQSDIYAFACLTAEMVRRKPLLINQSISDIEKFILAGNRPTLSDDCPKEINDVIKVSWHQDPKQRPLASDLLKQFGLIGGQFQKNGQNQKTIPHPATVYRAMPSP